MSLDMTGFLNAVKRAAVEAVEASKPVAVTQGRVVSVDPLQIRVEQKLILTEAQIIQTRIVGNVLSVGVQPVDDNGNNRLIIDKDGNNELNIDDEVLLLRANGGQKYLLIGKVGR